MLGSIYKLSAFSALLSREAAPLTGIFFAADLPLGKSRTSVCLFLFRPLAKAAFGIFVYSGTRNTDIALLKGRLQIVNKKAPAFLFSIVSAPFFTNSVL